jgi:hypothetical protein
MGSLLRVHYKYAVQSDMGAVQCWAKVEARPKEPYRIQGITPWDRLIRITFGRLRSYLSNPYRTPLLRGPWHEAQLSLSERFICGPRE